MPPRRVDTGSARWLRWLLVSLAACGPSVSLEPAPAAREPDRVSGERLRARLFDGGDGATALASASPRKDTSSASAAPTPPPPPRATALAAGTYATCARLDDGTARCWGRVFYTTYGDPPPAIRPESAAPVAVTGLGGVDALALGTFYACALRGGSVLCWGNNGSAQLGHGAPGNRYEPTRVSGLAGITALAAAPDHACALLGDGTMACWGSNFHGALGAAETSRGVAYAPVKVAGVAGAIAIAAGSTHTCAALADGTARCWGGNQRGQLGDGTKVSRPAPAAVRGIDEVVELALGDAMEVPIEARLSSEHSCARRRDGGVWCWGDNRFGQLGDGTRLDRAAPRKVEGIAGATAIAAGTGFTCALAGDGLVRCWGGNGDGQLGDGTREQRTRPVTVLGVAGAIAIAARGFHACALAAGGVWCWGHVPMAATAGASVQPIATRVAL